MKRSVNYAESTVVIKTQLMSRSIIFISIISTHINHFYAHCCELLLIAVVRMRMQIAVWLCDDRNFAVRFIHYPHSQKILRLSKICTTVKVSGMDMIVIWISTSIPSFIAESCTGYHWLLEFSLVVYSIHAACWCAKTIIPIILQEYSYNSQHKLISILIKVNICAEILWQFQSSIPS